jgi:hypothetical protein
MSFASLTSEQRAELAYARNCGALNCGRLKHCVASVPIISWKGQHLRCLRKRVTRFLKSDAGSQNLRAKITQKRPRLLQDLCLFSKSFGYFVPPAGPPVSASKPTSGATRRCGRLSRAKGPGPRQGLRNQFPSSGRSSITCGFGLGFGAQVASWAEPSRLETQASQAASPARGRRPPETVS